MSHKLELDKALDAYRLFIHGHSASSARNVDRRDSDPLAKPFVKVPRNEVLNVFLENHSEHKRFRKELLAKHDENHTFRFIEEQWRETVSGIPTA